MRGAPQRGLLRLIIPDQIPNLLRHAGPTGLAAADFLRPEQAKAFTMPGDNGFSLDDHQGGCPVAPHASQPDPRRFDQRASVSTVFGAERRKTASCCRKARFSSRNCAEVLSIEVRAPSTVNRRCCADQRSK